MGFKSKLNNLSINNHNPYKQNANSNLMKKLAGLALLCALPFLSGDAVKVQSPKPEFVHEIYNSPARPDLSKYLDESMKEKDEIYYTGYFSQELRVQIEKLRKPITPEEMSSISLDAYLEMHEAEETFHQTWNVEYAKKALALSEVTAMLSPNSYGPQAILKQIEIVEMLKVGNRN